MSEHASSLSGLVDVEDDPAPRGRGARYAIAVLAARTPNPTSVTDDG
jgi:hypothetical protein